MKHKVIRTFVERRNIENLCLQQDTDKLYRAVAYAPAPIKSWSYLFPEDLQSTSAVFKKDR